MARISKREELLRETKCLENIGEGLTKDQNINDLTKTFGVTHDTAEQIYFQTTRKVAGLREASLEELKAQVLCQMDILYKKSVAHKSYKTALDILMSKVKVSGLDEKEKSNADNKGRSELPKIIEVREKDFTKKG